MAIFRNKYPSISIKKIDNVTVDGFHHPFYEELIIKRINKILDEKISNHANKLPALEETDTSNGNWLLRNLGNIGKIVSLISAIGILTFITLLVFGITNVASIQITNLLSIVSFTLFGGLVSVGGFNILSINANLRKTNNELLKYVGVSEGCPFAQIVDEDAKQKYGIISSKEIHSKEFCSGCQLLDHMGRTICTVSPHYFR